LPFCIMVPSVFVSRSRKVWACPAGFVTILPV
jgi:hypothetical protein